ncbi:MAG: lamin tail domain-containing protein [Tidjanibacter sp.]|nr:lamin tail domain-containing protein [Tidjanibacter sp.]
MKRYLLILAFLAPLFTSCLKDEPYVGPSTIENFSYNPTAVTALDDVTVTADITYLNGGITASVKYTLDAGAEQTVAMTSVGNTFTGVIPKQNDDVVVSFYVSAINVDNVEAKSAVATYTVGDLPPDYTQLRLNELNGVVKFIEIYNSGTLRVKMEGVYIQKDDGLVWTCDDRLLEAGEYLLLWSADVALDHGDYDSNLFFNSGLSAKKNVRIQMFNPSGVSIDDFNITHHPGSAVAGSYGRNADGQWYIQTTATPNAVNVDGTQVVDFF